jgi:D-alanyl-D-alanine carboxypeptidase
MKQFFRLTILATTILFTSCNLSAQQKDNYSTKIDSLLQTKNPRDFNGVVYIQQNGKLKYAKAFGFANLNKKNTSKNRRQILYNVDSKTIYGYAYLTRS